MSRVMLSSGEKMRLPNVPEHAVSLWSQFDFANGWSFGATERQGDAHSADLSAA
jgi:outer membrane receptor for monomeric catechols